MKALLARLARAICLVLAILVCSAADAASQSAPDTSPDPAATPVQGAMSRDANGSMWRNVSLFGGLDGSKQPQDLGINANMGVRFSANVGVPVWERRGLGFQMGAAVNLSDAAVHVLEQIEGTSSRVQTFVTLGVFQAAGNRAHWGLVYDLLVQNYYDTATLGQVRGFAGYGVTATNEVGAWFAKSVQGADNVMGGTPVRLDPISQVNGYLAHTWPTAARTTVWAGVASGHHNIVWVLPDNSRDGRVFVYGAELDMPLSERFAVTGAAGFLSPAATGTVDAFLGLTYYPGGTARGGTRGAYAPRLGVANNPTLAVNMSR